MLKPQPDTKSNGVVPRHVAIIMDGNGRWAQRRLLPRVVGHQRGADAVRRTVEASLKQGIRYLTLYAFSSENWKRPPEEVKALMGLLKIYIKQEIDELDRNGVQIRFIGSQDRLSADILELIDMARSRTKNNARLTMVIALDYGGHDEIIRATRLLAQEVADGKLQPEQIDEHAIYRKLYTADMPDPELIIRTSGEQRLSNFLLWQAAYSEMVFMDLMWPDFDGDALAEAIEQFQGRERRFGARP